MLLPVPRASWMPQCYPGYGGRGRTTWVRNHHTQPVVAGFDVHGVNKAKARERRSRRGWYFCLGSSMRRARASSMTTSVQGVKNTVNGAEN